MSMSIQITSKFFTVQVYIGVYGADEDLNDEDEAMVTDPDMLHASWKGFDHESGITQFNVAVGRYPGDTCVTKEFLGNGMIIHALKNMSKQMQLLLMM